MANDSIPYIQNTLPDAVAGAPYNEIIQVIGGALPLQFSSDSDFIGNRKLPNGDPNKFLPPGLIINPITGALEGIPLGSNTYNFPIYVCDSFGHIATKFIDLTVSGEEELSYKRLLMGTPNIQYYWQLNEGNGSTFTDVINSAVLTSSTTIVSTIDPKPGYQGYTFGYESFDGKVTTNDSLLHIKNNIRNYTLEFWTNEFADTTNGKQYSIFYYGGNAAGSVSENNYLINLWFDTTTKFLSLDWQYGNGIVESHTFNIDISSYSYFVIKKNSIDKTLTLEAFVIDDSILTVSKIIPYVIEPSGGSRLPALFLNGIKSENTNAFKTKGVNQVSTMSGRSFSDLAFYSGQMAESFINLHLLVGYGISILNDQQLDPATFPAVTGNTAITIVNDSTLNEVLTIANGVSPYTLITIIKHLSSEVSIVFDNEANTITLTGDISTVDNSNINFIIEDSLNFQFEVNVTITITKPEVRIHRMHHAVTKLSNNGVLITGGFNDNVDAFGTYITTSQTYDILSGIVSPNDDLNIGRYSHTATSLLIPKTLITGGITSGGVTSSAELYDVGNDIFTIIDNMNVARTTHTATLLPNGKILLVGGAVSRVTELYIIDIGFVLSGSLIVSRFQHTATLLLDGTVLIVGGRNGSILNSAEIYHPNTETFTSTTGNLNIERFAHTATLLLDGTVLITGGKSNAGIEASAELYDPIAKTFTNVGNMNVERFNHTASLLNTGLVMVCGGEIESDPIYATEVAEKYNFSTQTFLILESMNLNRQFHASISINNGQQVLVTDGALKITNNDNVGQISLSGMDLYDTERETFQPVVFTYPPTYIIAQAHQIKDATIGVTVNGSSDDGFYPITIPFSFKVFGIDYGNDQNGGVFVGTNGYITFGFSSHAFSVSPDLGVAFMLCAGDRSSNFLRTYTDNKGAFRIRQEGGEFSADPTSETLVYEVTFFKNQKVNVVWKQCPGDGLMGISNGDFSMIYPTTFAANTSYAFESNPDGSIWTITPGSATF